MGDVLFSKAAVLPGCGGGGRAGERLPRRGGKGLIKLAQHVCAGEGPRERALGWEASRRRCPRSSRPHGGHRLGTEAGRRRPGKSSSPPATCRAAAAPGTGGLNCLRASARSPVPSCFPSQEFPRAARGVVLATCRALLGREARASHASILAREVCTLGVGCEGMRVRL